MITIKEISEKIGVSPTTVSNVIRGKASEVSPEMVKKVQEAITRYHYVPNMSARTLAQNSSRIIGVIFRFNPDKDTNIFRDPFEGELLGGLEAGIREAGYYLLVAGASGISDVLRLVESWNIDGLVLCGFQADEYCQIRANTEKPMVYVDCYFGEDTPPYDNVGLNDREAARDMTAYLIGKGHRKIAFLSDNRKGVDGERWQGFCDGMTAAHLPCGEESYLFLDPDSSRLPASMENLYRRHADFTALFFASDYYAVRGMDYLLDQGVAVPKQISVVGFDDNILGRHTRPGLTTMHQDPNQKGRMACNMLLALLRREHQPGQHLQLKAELVERSTVAPPSAK